MGANHVNPLHICGGARQWLVKSFQRSNMAASPPRMIVSHFFKHNTTKTQTCNCGSAESDAVAIVWPDISNCGGKKKKNTISKIYNVRPRGRKYKNMIWNLCVKLSSLTSCLVTIREGRTSSRRMRETGVAWGAFGELWNKPLSILA